MALMAMTVSFHITMMILVLFVLFYVGRTLYWKISASVHDIRQNKRNANQGSMMSRTRVPEMVGRWVEHLLDRGYFNKLSR